MSKGIKPEALGAAIEEQLTIYSSDVTNSIRAAAEKAAKDLVKKTKATAPVGKRKAYRKHIAMQETTKNRRAPSFTWHVKAPDHRLTHLLVHGHATKDGGRTKADPFLDNAVNEVLPAFERAVEEAIKK